jgi:anti-sigma regulatory factor (Ser/Thr protein kinase)
MSIVRSFDVVPSSARAARRFVADGLEQVEDEELRAVAVLMVSELASNSIRYGRSRYTVEVDLTPREIRIEVCDDGPGTPQRREPRPDEPTGRGLMIIDNLAHRWGVRQRKGETTVWFTLRRTTGPAGSTRRSAAAER